VPSILDIKARITAVENIKKLTRAMQLVAAAKFKRSEERARTTRPYSEELDGILSILAGLSLDQDESGAADATFELSFGEGERPIQVDADKFFEQPDEPEPKRPGLVLITSDRGLCGAFNTRLIRAALEFEKEHPEMDVQFIPIGRKGRAFFKARHIPVLHYEEGLSDKLDLEEIKRITTKLVDLYVSGEVDALYLVFAEFKSAMVSTVRVDKFLSIPRVEVDEERRHDDYILEPDPKAAYETLLPLYATTKIFATLADSFASEYGARMTAMQLATKNAEELLDALVILRNRMRQTTITTQLTEIVGGAEALK
jgi:F-type H+-transporting ATPase subunit gamma